MPNQSAHHTTHTHKKHTNPKQETWGKGRGGRPWMRRRERIFKRDKYLCQIHLKQGKYISVDLHGINAGICDHVIPLSQGGSDNDSNLQTICKACDKVKTQNESNANMMSKVTK